MVSRYQLWHSVPYGLRLAHARRWTKPKAYLRTSDGEWSTRASIDGLPADLSKLWCWIDTRWQWLRLGLTFIPICMESRENVYCHNADSLEGS